jgi:hypothetical protein
MPRRHRQAVWPPWAHGTWAGEIEVGLAPLTIPTSKEGAVDDTLRVIIDDITITT